MAKTKLPMLTLDLGGSDAGPAPTSEPVQSSGMLSFDTSSFAPASASLPAPPEPQEENKGFSLTRALITPIKGTWRALSYTLPTYLGHITEGDRESAAKVGGFTSAYKEAWNDTEGPWTEFMKGVSTAGGALGAIGQTFGVGIPKTLGYLAGGDTQAAIHESDQMLANIGKNFTERRTIGKVVVDEFDRLYPEYGSGVTHVIYKDRDGKIGHAEVANIEARDWLDEATKRGWQVSSVDVLGPQPILFGMTTNQTVAMAADMADPVMAGIFGGATKLGLKALGVAGRAAYAIPRVERAVDTVADYAGRATAPGTVIGNVIDDVENYAGSFRRSTIALRAKVYGMAGGRLESRALKAQLAYQAENVSSLLRGTNRAAINTAEDYLEATRYGDDVAKQHFAMKLVNQGFVGMGGDIDEAANTIARIGKMSRESRTVLDQLALAWREGDTTIDSVLQRVGEQGNVAVPDEIKKAYTQLRSAAYGERALAKAGPEVEIGDVATIANALRLPRGGMGVASETLQQTMEDFAGVLHGNIPESLRPTQAEVDTIAGTSPSFAFLSSAAKERLAAGIKGLTAARGEGLSEYALSQMRSGLNAAINTGFGGGAKIDQLVDKYMSGMETIQREVAPGVKVNAKIRARAFAVRKAVEDEAAAHGIDVDTLKGAVKLARDFDEQTGQMEVKLGILLPRQFEGMRGLHAKRFYAFFEQGGYADQKITELRRTDPVKAASLERELESLRLSRDTMENTRLLRPGAYGGASQSAGIERQGLSPAFRDMLGQFNNLSDVIELSGRKAAKDISQNTFYKSLYEAGLASDTPNPTVGHTKPLPQGKAWGALGGKFVDPILHNDLMHAAAEQTLQPGLVMRYWRKVMRVVKQTLVPFNPVAVRNNMVGNLIAQTLATGETDLGRVMSLHRAAIISLKDFDTVAQRMAKYSPSLRDASIGSELELGLMYAPEATSSTFERIALSKPYQALRQGFGQARDAWLKLTYSYQEAEGKLMIFHQATLPKIEGGLGMTDREAALYAERWMIDYADVPPIVEALRSKIGVFPFITYTYKMMGNLIKAPLERPDVVARLAKPAMGLDDIVPDEVKQTERAGLPEWAKDKLLIRLPGKESRYVNMEPYLPWAVFSTDAMDQAPPGLRQALGLLGPPFSTVIDLAYNRNKLTGADIVPDGADPVTASKLRMDYLLQQNPQIREAKGLWDALHGTSIRATQGPQRWWEVFSSVYNWKIDKVAELNYKRSQDELRKIVGYASQMQKSTTIGETEKEERIKRLLNMADQKRSEMREIADGMVRIAGLPELLAQSGMDSEQLRWVEQWYVDQPQPRPELKEQVATDRTGLIPGQRPDLTANSRTLPMLTLNAAQALRSAPMPRSNIERLESANINMQPKPYAIPQGYDKPVSELPE